MKILLLTPFLPYPPQATDRIRSFYWLKHLSKKYKVYLVSFIESIQEREYLNKLDKYCSQIVTVLRRPKNGLPYRVMNLFQKFPYHIVKQFESIEIQERINLILEENKFDLMYVSALPMAQYVCDIKGVPRILEAVDCHTRNYLQQWRLGTGLGHKILSFIDWYKMKQYEPEVYSKFDKCILANSIDKEFMAQLDPKLSIEVVPNGVELEYFKPQIVEEDFPSLIFTGPMNYAPNMDAMIYFCIDILPLIEKKYPQIKLYITGKNISGKLKKTFAVKKNVIFTGFIEDIRTLIAKATIFICPLRTGTGIKFKILEAMAMGKPIVSSSIGIEGINAISGKDIMVTDEPEKFAWIVIKLLENGSLRSTIGARARAIVESDHSWESLAMDIDEICRKEINKNR